MLEFEAPRLLEVQTEPSAQYVDHNLLQADYRNADASSPAGTMDRRLKHMRSRSRPCGARVGNAR